MENRRDNVNSIDAEINHLYKAQERDNVSIEDIKKLKLNPNIIHEKIDEIKNRINTREEKINNLIDKRGRTERGEINNFVLPKINVAVEVKEVVVKKQQRENENSDYSIRKQFEIFKSIGNSLPEYMVKNLSEMPNNKGYIHRGCWFFGKLQPERNQPQIMFEKKGRFMNIHEITEYEYKIYQKIGKEPRKLISKRNRVKRVMFKRLY